MVEVSKTVDKKPEAKRKHSAQRQKVDSSHLANPSTDRILFLQKTAGNRAVQKLMESGWVQAKLRVGPQGDKYENEAERVAKQVVTSTQLEGARAAISDNKQHRSIQLRTQHSSDTAGESVPDNFIQLLGHGQPMNPSTKRVLESHIGADFSNVRVHSGPASHEAAKSLNARAFTYKNDIYLGSGESQNNIQLMAHESTHVVQQGAAIQRSPDDEASTSSNKGFWERAKDAVLEKVDNLVVKIPGFSLLCFILGRNPLTDKPVERNAINLIHGALGLVPGGEAIFDNLKKSGAIEDAFTWLNEQIEKLNLTWETIKALFNQAWDSLSITDLANPSKGFEKVQNIFGPTLERIKNFAIAAGKKILDFIFEGVLKLAGPLGTKVLEIIRKAGDTISKIISDPIGFLGNLIQAVRKGFEQFAGNILTHLKEGLMKWLFGALSGAGLSLPAKFDLMGILSIVLQVLGLTYAKFRGKLVKILGEKPVVFIEKAFEFLYLIVTKGLAAAWEKFLEYIGDLKEMVISAINDWVVVTIVKKAIMKLASMFNPAGAVVQAIMITYDTITFFIERAKQIIELAEAVFDSIANIASGNPDAAANYVEKTMARTIPVVIGFLASLIGLGGISEKIKKIIQGIQAKVDKALDKIVNFIVTKVKALFGKGEKKEVDTPENQWEKGVKGVKAAISQLKKEEISEEKIKPHMSRWQKDFGFTALTLNTKTTPWDIDGEMSPGRKVTEVESNSEGPEVDTYGALLSKANKNDKEAHHVPPKGLLGWLVQTAQSVVKNNFPNGKIPTEYKWIQDLARVDSNNYDPGDPLSAISIHKHTHIKKQNNPEKDSWRAHFGKKTALEVFQRLQNKGLTLIYRMKYSQLSKEDKNKYEELVLEAHGNLENLKAEEIKEGKSKSPISTQFFSTELDAALKQLKKAKADEMEHLQENIGNVSRGAAHIAYEAVDVALGKSKKDGPKEKIETALGQLRIKAVETWNNFKAIGFLRLFG